MIVSEQGLSASSNRNLGIMSPHGCTRWRVARIGTNIAMRAGTQYAASQGPTTRCSPRVAVGAAQQSITANNAAVRSAPRSNVVAGGARRHTTLAHVANDNHITATLPTWQGRDTWPHVGPRTTHECIACQQRHVTICIALHRIALRLSFASRRTTFTHVGAFVQDCNHIANLAGSQHVGTRWRTCDLPLWQTYVHNGRMNRYFRQRRRNRGTREQLRY